MSLTIEYSANACSIRQNEETVLIASFFQCSTEANRFLEHTNRMTNRLDVNFTHFLF